MNGSSRGKWRGNSGRRGRGRENQFVSTHREERNEIGNFSSHTNDVRQMPSGSSSLNPFAQPFVPKVTSNNESRSAPKVQDRPEDTPESLRARLIMELEREMYECVICCEKLLFKQATWACSSCYSVFHLFCIQKWAHKSRDPQGSSDWRCPGCQKESGSIPNEYRCFCLKVVHPRPRRGEQSAHACGQICRRQRENGCPHLCNVECHPGPCPPCPRNAKVKCSCGKSEKLVRCGTVPDYQCGNVCGKPLRCGKHNCKNSCHVGPCETCDEIIKQTCFCSKSDRFLPCAAEIESEFSCGSICERLLKCQIHNCKQPCHKGECGTCPLAPENVFRCPCGKTAVDRSERSACTDPIRTCGAICGKPFACGPDNEPHTCEAPCHEGTCPPCTKSSLVKCRCEKTQKSVPCAQIVDPNAEPVTCDFPCKKSKSCRRHKCGVVCCGDREHICAQICGKKLSCGLHVCDNLCHSGKCHPCLHAGFDELSCHCGAEVIFPPIPCGTQPPLCNLPCSRVHGCEHPVAHPCHNNPVCPPCAFLTRKACHGNHEIRGNIPCHLEALSCGNPCGVPLPCGIHFCRKPCHPHKDEEEECVQPCTQPREDCGHLCGLKCHSTTPCPPSVCKAEIKLTCSCGTLTKMLLCNEAERLFATLAASETLLKGGGIQILKRKHIPCDEDCGRVERNKILASALDIQSPDLIGERAPAYTEFLKEQYKSGPNFIISVEKAFTTLIDDVEKLVHQNTKSHIFQPMNRDQRRVVHEYAEYFQLDTQSFDPEPKRNVVATARKSRSKPPLMLLSESMPSKGTSKILPPPPNKSESGGGEHDFQKLRNTAVFRR